MKCKCPDDRNQFRLTSGNMWCPECRVEECDI